MNWKKSATTFLIGLLVLSGCTDTQDAPPAELSAELPGVNPGATDFLECFEAEGGGDLTFKDTDTDGFFLFSFPGSTNPNPSDAMRVIAESCHLELEIMASSSGFEFSSYFDYFINLIWDTPNAFGRYRPDAPALEGGAASLQAERVCNEFGCVDIHSQLAGARDGVVEKGLGVSPNKLAWDRDLLPLYDPTFDANALTGLDRIAANAAQSVVRVIGDLCMDQSGSGLLSETVLANTVPLSGFFVSDSIVMTSAVATLDYSSADKPGVDLGPALPTGITCEEHAANLTGGSPSLDIRAGGGPVLQLFDGSWALGEVIWKNESEFLPMDDYGNRALVRLVSRTDDRTQPFSQWETWPIGQTVFLPLPIADSKVQELAETVTIHHPEKTLRTSGSWQLTNADARFCSYNQKPSSAEPAQFFLAHYSDIGSLGGPILNNQGQVVGTIGSSAAPNVAVDSPCPANEASTNRNALGVLSNFYADASKLAVGNIVGPEDQRAMASFGVERVTQTPQYDLSSLRWPKLRAADIDSFEIPVFDEGLTVSGFPLSEFDTPAIDHLRQATVMMIKEVGCESCKANTENTDFSVPCYCTGFAISDRLIVTNDHCVPNLNVRDRSAVKTYSGEEFVVTLVGKSSIDGEEFLSPQYEEIYGDIGGNETGYERGDVALFRTDKPMSVSPVKFADSSELQQFEPLITVGHPANMSRTGPFVTSVGSFHSANYFNRTMQSYHLPADSGASGSAVVNLRGELVGQIAHGGPKHIVERESTLLQKYDFKALELEVDQFGSFPAPFVIQNRVPISLPLSGGAPSNYILELVNKWAPGEITQ